MPYYPPRYLFRRHAILQVLQKNKTFLEIGPGNFLLSVELLNYFQKGTLVDFNVQAESVFQRYPKDITDRFHLIIADFMTYSFPKKFNCIIACEVMEHVEDDLAFLQKIYQLLTNNGQVIISVPSRMKMWSEHDELVGHIRRYEKNKLETIAKKVGFRQVKIDSYGFPFVNILGLLRIRKAKKIKKKYTHLTQEELTKFSGIEQTENMSKYLGYFINPLSIFPATLFSRLFNRYDLSNGYLLSAIRDS